MMQQWNRYGYPLIYSLKIYNLQTTRNYTAKIYIDNARYMEFIDDIATQITIQRFGEDTYAPSSEVGQEHVMISRGCSRFL